MKNYTYRTASSEETIALGKKIGERLRKGDVLAMQGTLGAGKTTITKGIAESLGIEETITSPTFCLISEYYGKMPLYHMDVYRLGGTEDFADLGTDDMIYGDGVCIIEWSEKIMSELPDSTIVVRIEKASSAGAGKSASGDASAGVEASADAGESSNADNSASGDVSASRRVITLENWKYGALDFATMS